MFWVRNGISGFMAKVDVTAERFESYNWSGLSASAPLAGE